MSIRVDGPQGGGGHIIHLPHDLKSKHDSSMSDESSRMTYLFVILGSKSIDGIG